MVQTQSLWFRTALLPDGWASGVRLRIREGLIDRVERDSEPAAGEPVHAVALPGVGNVHSHAFQRGMAGLAEHRGPEADDFWTWREAMYRFLDRLEPDDVVAIAAQAYVEMLESGFTRVGEFHYLHHAPDGSAYENAGEMMVSIAEAADHTGIGLTLLPVFYAHGGFGGTAPTPGQRRFISDTELYSRLVESARRAVARLDGASVGVAPHSLRAATPAELERVLELGTTGPVHIHAAEQIREVDDCVAWSGQRPVEWLLDHVSVDRRWCLVHATHMTPGETLRLAESGAVAGLCPVTEANLGDGLFRAPEYLHARGALGIGTDSNVAIDAAVELRMLEYGQRLLHRARNVLAIDPSRSTGRQLFDAAVAGGARALGVAAAVLSTPLPHGLVEGAAADVVTLDVEHAALGGRERDALLDSWVFTGGRDAVDCVWVRGRKVVSGGRHGARHDVAARYRRVIRDVLES
jgi:formiminoglutamate deiminase